MTAPILKAALVFISLLGFVIITNPKALMKLSLLAINKTYKKDKKLERNML